MKRKKSESGEQLASGLRRLSSNTFTSTVRLGKQRIWDPDQLQVFKKVKDFEDILCRPEAKCSPLSDFFPFISSSELKFISREHRRNSSWNLLSSSNCDDLAVLP